MGPVEYIVVEFPGSRFSGRIVPELKALVESAQIRILDLLFVRKTEDGRIEDIELDALHPDDVTAFDTLDGELESLLSHEDATAIAAELDVGSSAAILVWEDTWAAGLADAVRESGGRILANEKVPAEVVDAARAALA